MIKRIVLFLLILTTISCKEMPKQNTCTCGTADSTSQATAMIDNLKTFDVKVTEIPRTQVFQRKGCGELRSVSFTNFVAAKNLFLKIEILVDSSQTFEFPVSYGRLTEKGYYSPAANYKTNSGYSLPLNKSLSFCKSCIVSFIISPITENPIPKGNNKGAFYNMQVIWSK